MKRPPSARWEWVSSSEEDEDEDNDDECPRNSAKNTRNDATKKIPEEEEEENGEEEEEDKFSGFSILPCDVKRVLLSKCRPCDLFVMRIVNKYLYTTLHSMFTSTGSDNPSGREKSVQVHALPPMKITKAVGTLGSTYIHLKRYFLSFHLIHEVLFDDLFKGGDLALVDFLFGDRTFVPKDDLEERGRRRNISHIESVFTDGETMEKNEMVDPGYALYAVEGDHLELLKWCHQHHCHGNSMEMLAKAATCGSLDVLEWLCFDFLLKDDGNDRGFEKLGNWIAPDLGLGSWYRPVPRWVCLKSQLFALGIWGDAIRAGQLKVLKWCKRTGIPWNNNVCTMAASLSWDMHDSALEIMKWYKKSGFPWKREAVMTWSISSGNLGLAKWLFENGCLRDKATGKLKNDKQYAVMNNFMILLKDAMKPVFPSSEKMSDPSSYPSESPRSLRYKDECLGIIRWLTSPEVGCPNPIFVDCGGDHPRNLKTAEKMALELILNSGHAPKLLADEAAKYGAIEVLAVLLDRKYELAEPGESMTRTLLRWKEINGKHDKSGISDFRTYHQVVSHIVVHRPSCCYKNGDCVCRVEVFQRWVDEKIVLLSLQK